MNRFGILIVAALVVWAHPAAAWDSICYRYQDATAEVSMLQHTTRNCEGVDAARGRWRDPGRMVDEHRRIFELAVRRAGLPSTLLETLRLQVLTDSASRVVGGGSGNVPTVSPMAVGAARRAVVRAFSLDEFAQLPDFSYSLWDWARGNEQCPLDLPANYSAPQECHVFKSHMGAVNSHHFPPQSDQWFDYYHNLALERAASCRTTRAAVWDAEPAPRRAATDARFADSWRACEVEALAYEAIAQHHMQDSWSAGHTWQRWGSTNLSDFPHDIPANLLLDGAIGYLWDAADWRLRRLMVAEIVAATAGTIHGSDPVLFETTSSWLTLRDPLCFPDENVVASRNGTQLQMVGDLHLHDAVGGPPLHTAISLGQLPYPEARLSGQAERILSCSAGSLGEVYAALGDGGTGRFGHPVLGASTLPAPPFDRNACRAFSVTNAGFNAGIDATNIQVDVGTFGAARLLIPATVSARVRDEYGYLRTAARLLARQRPQGTELASLQFPSGVSYEEQYCTSWGCTMRPVTLQPTVFTLLGVKRNECYASGGGEGCTSQPPGDALPAAFADPRLSGPLASPNPSQASGALALAFHASRAPQLCNALTEADLVGLRSLVTMATTDAERGTACDACAEYVLPFLRIGTDAGRYDTTAEPLCKFTAADPASVPYVYEPATNTANPVVLARRYCGCKGLVAATDTGLQRLSVTEIGATVQLSQSGPRLPVGGAPRDIAAASGGRLLITTASGQIAGVRNDVAVDLDGNPANGITRLAFPGITNLQGVAVANVGGKELVLAVAPATGELVAYDLGAHEYCARITVGRTAGEGAYDIVVPGNGTKILVSLRKVSPLAGAIAVVDPIALARCDGSAAATVRYLTPPGAVVGLGPMALSPDGRLLAVGGRYASTCLDQIRNIWGTQQDIQVGCDRIFIMDVATETFRLYGTSTGLPTRPGRYPYAVAWFEDGVRLAYAAFQGIDAVGSGNSGWPMGSPTPLPLGGTLRLADTANASYLGGGGTVSRNWTYNMPLNSNVIGESVAVDGNWVFVGTGSGRVSGYEVAPHDSSLDPMWEASDADPETTLHVSTNGTWYGGCGYRCSLPGAVCPSVCPGGTAPARFSSTELGAGVRALISY